eukprot:scaffold6162_cov116-Isochrysis_galbana.AAC.2
MGSSLPLILEDIVPLSIPTTSTLHSCTGTCERTRSHHHTMLQSTALSVNLCVSARTESELGGNPDGVPTALDRQLRKPLRPIHPARGTGDRGKAKRPGGSRGGAAAGGCTAPCPWRGARGG